MAALPTARAPCPLRFAAMPGWGRSVERRTPCCALPSELAASPLGGEPATPEPASQSVPALQTRALASTQGPAARTARGCTARATARPVLCRAHCLSTRARRARAPAGCALHAAPAPPAGPAALERTVAGRGAGTTRYFASCVSRLFADPGPPSQRGTSSPPGDPILPLALPSSARIRLLVPDMLACMRSSQRQGSTAPRGHSQTGCTRAPGRARTGKKQLHARHILITPQRKRAPAPSLTLRPPRAACDAGRPATAACASADGRAVVVGGPPLPSAYSCQRPACVAD
ncbi:uncharacterized protein CC84DRAFT_1175728 [Paraphaeosphaeria sporulosa]|uniref:Uncharacterized protein n=1 Tax=Paraphaeosphaeria sporulosa TaxID=1460663 RepID=A0A177CD33_9PLEO|nr:uncharacterized protein CC84DRAFT_1175728 [Paraphaeosphaeria sporulosa]OAG05573.1 hypothetical protein CC84DRAFT_1175728 [Paraphaeosphaeria sporulosa]